MRVLMSELRSDVSPHLKGDFLVSATFATLKWNVCALEWVIDAPSVGVS